jgi:signal peptidase
MENIKIFASMFIIGAILLYIGTSVFMPEMTIKIFRFQPYIVMTESMEPVINVNDMVIVRPFDIDEAEVGDIITFQADIDYNGTKETVTHYIYSIDDSGSEPIIRTNRHFEEDETVTPDTWLIPASDVMGSYGFQIAYVGYIVGFVTSIYGIGVIGLNIAIIATIKYLKNKEEQQEVSTDPTPNNAA